jgi:hypothetical protein
LAPKVTVKGLARAMNEYLDTMGELSQGTYGNNLTPTQIMKAGKAAEKLDRMMERINMEAKDGTSRRISKKKRGIR